MVAVPYQPDHLLDADDCCRAMARLLRLRNRPELSERRRRLIACRLIALCDRLQASCLSHG